MAQMDIYQKDIEAHFGITRATASKVITLMEKKGLIQRVSTESELMNYWISIIIIGLI